MKKYLSVFIAFGIIFVGAISVFAQKKSSTPLMDHRAYVGAFIGGNTSGTQRNTTDAVSGAGSVSLATLTETGGLAGGAELGYYSHHFGAELDDVAMGWTIPTQYVTATIGNTSGSMNFQKLTGTRNVFLLNGLGRIPISTSWGMWYPYLGIGPGFIAGTAQEPGSTTTLTMNPSWAFDFKIGAAFVWQNGFGLFIESQGIGAGINLSATSPTTAASATMTGTSINNVADVGVNYTFKL